jgi:hypothetical protein
MTRVAISGLWRAAFAAFLITGRLLAAQPSTSNAARLVFFKPNGGTLQVLVRLPLETIRDLVVVDDPPGELKAAEIENVLGQVAALWAQQSFDVYEGSAKLEHVRIAAARVSLVVDHSYDSVDQALRHFSAPPLSAETKLNPDQVALDLFFEYSIHLSLSSFSVHVDSAAHLGSPVTTVLSFLPDGSPGSRFQFVGDPGLVRFNPTLLEAAFQFLHLGFTQLVNNVDCLAFFLCLAFPVTNLRTLLRVAVAFSAFHPLTMAAASAGLFAEQAWLPLIQFLVAAAIVILAFDNLANGAASRRWICGLAFGLIYGIDFSFVLQRMEQFAGTHRAGAWLWFTLGIELAEILVLALVFPAVRALFRVTEDARIVRIIVSVLLAHVAWHWMVDRSGAMRVYAPNWARLMVAIRNLGVGSAVLAVTVLCFTLLALAYFQMSHKAKTSVFRTIDIDFGRYLRRLQKGLN